MNKHKVPSRIPTRTTTWENSNASWALSASICDVINVHYSICVLRTRCTEEREREKIRFAVIVPIYLHRDSYPAGGQRRRAYNVCIMCLGKRDAVTAATASVDRLPFLVVAVTNTRWRLLTSDESGVYVCVYTYTYIFNTERENRVFIYMARSRESRMGWGMVNGGGGVNKSVCIRSRVHAGERYCQRQRRLYYWTTMTFWGVKNFQREFIFDPCHVPLAPWNSKTGLGIKLRHLNMNVQAYTTMYNNI